MILCYNTPQLLLCHLYWSPRAGGKDADGGRVMLNILTFGVSIKAKNNLTVWTILERAREAD